MFMEVVRLLGVPYHWGIYTAAGELLSVAVV